MFQATMRENETSPASAGDATRGVGRSLRVPRRQAGDYRIDALTLTSPWLAGLAAICALATLWSSAGTTDPLRLGAWAMLLIAVNLVAVRTRLRGPSVAAPERFSSVHWTVAETAAQALPWAVLPGVVAVHGPAQAMVVGGALCTMMAGAALLSVVPVAATVWLAALAGGLCWTIAAGGAAMPPGLLLLVPAYVTVLLVGCIVLERLLVRVSGDVGIERERRQSADLLLNEYEQQGIGWLWQADSAHLLTYVSPGACTLLGRARRELIGQSVPVLFGCDARLGGAMAARAAFAGIEIEVATPAGPRFVSISGTPSERDGAFDGYRGVGADITEARRSQQRLTELAAVDVLTGLPNRQRMRELFAQAVQRAQTGVSPCAIMFLDLDGFKPVNDTFGHPTGDAVLRTVAQRLARAVGSLGQVGRVGGDEFALLLFDGSSRRFVEELGRKLIRAVSEPYCFDGSTEIRIGVSIGVAFAPVDGSTVDDLLLKADLALYQAKSAGRGAVMLFDSRMQREAEDRLRLEHDLRLALAREQLELHYQPVVCAVTQHILGFEALLRWNHPERGMVAPGAFIALAEESGLIGEIGEWVIRTACHDAAAWPDGLFVSVNLSPRQLTLPALPNAISEALTASRLAPNRLELEVTESVFLSDDDGSLDALRRVRTLGVGIALDDFGTGYSSLGYLNKTIFHTLKIDGGFVRDAAKRSETVTIIRAIVSLASSFRMTITAEGIETAEDFERMRDLGCHKLQGYLFGRPMPHAETLKLVGGRWVLEQMRA